MIEPKEGPENGERKIEQQTEQLEDATRALPPPPSRESRRRCRMPLRFRRRRHRRHRRPALLLRVEVVKLGAGIVCDTLNLESAPNRSAESFFRLDRERSDRSPVEMAGFAPEGARERRRLCLDLGVLGEKRWVRNGKSGRESALT